MKYFEQVEFDRQWTEHMSNRNKWVEAQDPELHKHLVWDPLEEFNQKHLAVQFYIMGIKWGKS